VVVIAIACVAPGATAGVMLKVSGEAARPVATGTVTVQETGDTECQRGRAETSCDRNSDGAGYCSRSPLCQSSNNIRSSTRASNNSVAYRTPCYRIVERWSNSQREASGVRPDSKSAAHADAVGTSRSSSSRRDGNSLSSARSNSRSNAER